MKRWLFKSNLEGVTNFDVISLFLIMPTVFYLLCLLVTYKP